MDQDSLNDFIEKVKKTLFMAELAELLSEAADAEKHNDFQLAIKYYNTVIQIAESSRYFQASWAKSIIANTHSQVHASKNQYDTNIKINWLNDNYQTIFRSIFNVPNSSRLLYPSVIYLGEENKNKLFKISCIAKDNGKPARLILHYLHIAAEDRWEIHPGQ